MSTPSITPWPEVASRLGDVSQQEYDTARVEYFKQHVMPSLPKGSQPQAEWEYFKKNTERPISLAQRGKAAGAALLKTAVGVTTELTDIGRKMVPEVTPAHVASVKFEKELQATMERGGMGRSGEILKAVGTLGGAGLAFEAGAKAAEAPLGLLDIPTRVARILKGGTAFGVFEAATAQEGDRLTAGAKGFAMGVGIEVGLSKVESALSAATLLKRRGVPEQAVDNAIRDSLTGEGSSPEVDDVVTKVIKRDSIASRQEGRPQFVQENPAIRGIQVHVEDPTGTPRVVPVVVNKEAIAVEQIQDLVSQGGKVVGIQYHPDEVGNVNRFMRMSSDISTEMYESAKRIQLTRESSPEVAKELESAGVVAEEVGDKVILHQPPKFPPKPEEIDAFLAGLKDSEGFELSKAEKAGYKKRIQDLWNPGTPERLKFHNASGLVNDTVYDFEGIIPEKYRGLRYSEMSSAVNPEKPDDERVDSLLKTLRDPEGKPLEVTTRDLIKTHLRNIWDERIPDESNIKKQAANFLKRVGVTDGYLPETFRAGPRVEPVFTAVALPPEAEAAGTAMDELIKKFSADPENVDIDLLRATGEAGVERIMEILEKSRDIKHPGVIEEAVRKGEVPGKAIAKLSIPPSERIQVREVAPGRHRVFELAPIERPTHVGVKLPTEIIEALKPGAEALTYPHYEAILMQFGVDISKLPDLLKPAVAYSSGVARETAFHESIHVGLVNLWRDGNWQLPGLLKETKSTAAQIANMLKKYPAYKSSSALDLVEEAYIHAATAIRMGNVRDLTTLARFDTDVDHIYQMVRNATEGLLGRIPWQIDSAPLRILQRKLQNLMVITGETRSWELRNAVKESFADMWFDPETITWKYQSGDSTIEIPGSIKDVADYLLQENASHAAPSHTLWAEYRGVRGPIVPRGGEPGGNPPMPRIGPSKDWKWVGWNTLSAAWRPFLPWVSTVHEKFNRELLAKGKGEYLPLLERVRALDERAKAGDDWLSANRDSASKFMEGVGSKKLMDYFEVLTTEQKHWGQMAEKLNLSKKDLANLQQAEKWLRDYSADTHIPAFNWLRDEFVRLRNFGFREEMVYGRGARTSREMGIFHKALQEGDLDPKDAHLGRFVDFLLQTGYEKKFTGEALANLRQLVDLKTKDGNYVLGTMRWPLENYYKYMKGIPDVTQQAIMRTLGDFQKNLAEKFTELNKHLPKFAQLPTDFKYPGGLLQKMMTWSYAAGLGLRVAIPVRDSLQLFSTSMPILGPTKLFRGIASSMTKEGVELAENAGAFLNKRNIGELYGDIFREIPVAKTTDKITKLANQLLAPSRIGHNIARGAAFNAEYLSVLDSVKLLREGRMSEQEFIREGSSLWWADKPVAGKILEMAKSSSVPAEEVAKRAGLELLDNTLWPYRRGAQPTLLRTGLGRVFGQYGMWPMNYLDFLKRGAGKFREHPKQALMATAYWTASNYAAVKSMEALGADTNKWFFFSPAGYGLSPHAQFVGYLFKAPEETPDGLEARRKAMEYPLQFIPTSNELKAIATAMDEGGPAFDGEGRPTPQLLRVLGFKPLKEQPDRTFEEEVKHELGYGQRRP